MNWFKRAVSRLDCVVASLISTSLNLVKKDSICLDADTSNNQFLFTQGSSFNINKTSVHKEKQ